MVRLAWGSSGRVVQGGPWGTSSQGRGATRSGLLLAWDSSGRGRAVQLVAPAGQGAEGHGAPTAGSLGLRLRGGTRASSQPGAPAAEGRHLGLWGGRETTREERMGLGASVPKRGLHPPPMLVTNLSSRACVNTH